MHVFSQGFANLLSQKYFSFASFRKCDFKLACFCKLWANLQIWFSCTFTVFASFSKFLQFVLFSQAFARICKNSKMNFCRDSPRVRKYENHGFLQGFAMGTLLMYTDKSKSKCHVSVMQSNSSLVPACHSTAAAGAPPVPLQGQSAQQHLSAS